jgi:site-specific recombinase XerD
MPSDNRNIFEEYDKDGKFEGIALSKYWPDGSRFRRRFPNVTIAKKMRARIEEAIAMGTWRELKQELYEDPKTDPLIKDFADVYLKEYCQVHNSRPDFKKETLSTIKDIVGHIRLTQFRRIDAKYFEIERAKQVAGATVNRGLAVLSNMMTFALDKGLIAIHPMVRYKRIKEERPALQVMTLEEERKIVGRLLERDLIVGIYCGLLGETGMRPEEGLRVQHPFINQAQRLLTVDKTKTKKARHIPLSDYALELIGMAPRILTNPYLLVRLETSRGVDPVTVQELLGHADIHTTMRYTQTTRHCWFSPSSYFSVLSRILYFNQEINRRTNYGYLKNHKRQRRSISQNRNQI